MASHAYSGSSHSIVSMGDSTRIAAGVVTGVGFLGAGVILVQPTRHGNPTLMGESFC